jgi:hypothetical protein
VARELIGQRGLAHTIGTWRAAALGRVGIRALVFYWWARGHRGQGGEKHYRRGKRKNAAKDYLH